VRVVLVRPRNPLNIGAAARAMSNFGFTDLALVDPYDLAFREAKSAVGAAAVIESAQVFDSVAAAIRDFTLVVGTTGGDRREMSQTLRRLEAGARLMRKHRGAVALLFGSEKSGLSNDDISHCHWLIQIPSRSGHRSMNLGQSVAVCLYELIRDSKAASQKALDKKLAASGELEILHERLSEALERSGYYDHTARRGSANRLRALLRRLHLTAHDAEVWLGIFRQVLWRLKRESDLR
jgi:tRNA/rRNA methyltransferase